MNPVTSNHRTSYGTLKMIPVFIKLSLAVNQMKHKLAQTWVVAFGHIRELVVRGAGVLVHAVRALNTTHHHHHHTTPNATLPRNAKTRYPPKRHTIPNEHQWEENWVKTGLSSSRLTDRSFGAAKS